MDHGVWHQARDAAGRLYFFNDAGETRWDWPGGEAAPLAVQNGFAGALQQPAAAGGNAPISRELAERCLGEMRRDKAELARLTGELAAAATDRAALADRDSQRDAQFAAAVADRAALAAATAESRRAAADRALSCATAALADARLATEARLPDVEAAWARAWPAPAPALPPDDEGLLQTLLDEAAAPPPPPEDEDDDDDDGMAFDPALLQPATRWPGPTGGDSSDDDDDTPPPVTRPTRAPKRPKKLEDAAPAPKKRARVARVSTDGPLARHPPGATAAAPGSIMATAARQLSDTLYSKKQILEVMPNGQGSHVPAVYASGGTIYALCFSEDANPGLPTVVEISCGTARKRQVGQFESLKEKKGTVPLFLCLRTARGKLELLPGGSGSKGFRFAGMRSVVSVQTHSRPKMVGGEARQATVTLSAPTAGGTCPLQVAGIPRAIQVAGAPAPAPAPPPQPVAPPVTPAPAPPPQPAAQPRMVTSGAVWSEGAASGVMVRCPEGVGVGQTLMFEQSESGRKFKVVVPAGVSPGQEFRVPLPS